MSGAYWFAGLNHAWNPPPDSDAKGIFASRLEAVSALATAAGLPLKRLERLDWFTAGMNSLYRREALAPDNSAQPLSLLWPALPLLSHTLFQNICAGLVLEENQLSGLVEENQGAVQAVLLGSPSAVGKYNLIPHARFAAHFSGWWTSAPLLDTFAPLREFLEKHEVAPDAIGSLAVSSLFKAGELKKPPEFENTEMLVESGNSGVILPLNRLVESLKSGRASAGLLASISADHRILITLVEAV